MITQLCFYSLSSSSKVIFTVTRYSVSCTVPFTTELNIKEQLINLVAYPSAKQKCKQLWTAILNRQHTSISTVSLIGPHTIIFDLGDVPDKIKVPLMFQPYLHLTVQGGGSLQWEQDETMFQTIYLRHCTAASKRDNDSTVSWLPCRHLEKKSGLGELYIRWRKCVGWYTSLNNCNNNWCFLPCLLFWWHNRNACFPKNQNIEQMIDSILRR